MINIILLLTYLGCLSSNAMLSMLLLLVSTYMTASIWLITNSVIYAGILYLLVYVGAIVVLIIFVVQLTNTSLQSNSISLITNFNVVKQTLFLMIILGLLLLISTDLINLLSYNTIVNAYTYINVTMNYNMLTNLSISLFNEYAYLLILSIHGILLAIIGPIKLALNNHL